MANGRQVLYDALKTLTFSLSQGLAAQSQAPGRRGSQMGMAAAFGAPMLMQDMETKRVQQEQESALRKRQIEEMIRAGRVDEAVALLNINPRAAEAKLPDYTNAVQFEGMAPEFGAPPVQQGGTFEAPLPPIPVPLASGTINMPQTSSQQMGRDALAKVFGTEKARSMFQPPPVQIPGRDVPLSPEVEAQRTAMALAAQRPTSVAQIPGRDIPFPPDVQAQRERERAVAARPGGLTTNQEALQVNRLSKEWTSATQTQRELRRQVGVMDLGLEAARKGDMAAGSQAILVTFQKILDPGSVVRESEYARSAAGQSLLARIEGAMDRLTKGGAGVPLSELEKFGALAKQMASGSSSSISGIRKRIEAQADRYGIPRDLVLDNEATDTTARPRAEDAKGNAVEWDGTAWVPVSK